MSIFVEFGTSTDIPFLKELIDSGIDINSQDKSGNTLLMRAVNNGRTRTVKLLIAAGADLNIRNKHGTTALMLAVRNNDHCNIIKMLLDAGADFNIKKNGKTAYQQSCKSAKKLILNKVLENEFNKRKLLRLTQSGKLPTEVYKEIGKFLFGRRKYSRH